VSVLINIVSRPCQRPKNTFYKLNTSAECPKGVRHRNMPLKRQVRASSTDGILV